MTCFDDEMVLGLVEGRLAQRGADAEVDAAFAHLDDCESCRALVTLLARGQDAEHVLARGHTLGRYVVGDLLGTGAMGRVYSAWEPELDRRVAIKVLRERAGDARERLVREAQAMARLAHPNIVGVHEVGTTSDGVFVAMELVEGDTLRAWAESRRPWREVARVLVEITRGLHAVHAAGVIHRDIKPDNIIVGTDGRARLGDFGLARSGATAGSARPAGDTVLAQGTPATAIAGTPAYMAPEVLRGGSATAASDQFAFGVTAYEILTGARPFVGATWAELSRAVERGTVAPIRSVPAWLDAAIRRCLTGDPARRHASLAALGDLLADRLQRRRPTVWLAGLASVGVLASAVTWLASRDPAQAAAPTCELGADEIATVWTPEAKARLATHGAPITTAIERWTTRWSAERDATCASAARDPAVLAARTRCLDDRRLELAALLDRAVISTGPIDRLVDALDALPPSECRAATTGAADPVPLDPERAAGVQAIQRELPAVRAAIALGDARPVTATVATLVERARAAAHAPTLAEVLLAATEIARATARLDDATRSARDAVAAAERGHDDLAAARAWVARVTIAGDRRDLAAAEDLAIVAGAAIDRAGAPPRQVAQLLRLRALVAYNRGRFAEAVALLVDARARFAAIGGERSSDVSGVESSLGSAARALGDLAAADQHHRAALAIDRELRGPNHPDLARDLHNIAGVQRLRGELDAARATYEAALAIEIATRGERSVEAGLTHNSLGLVLLARLDHPGARAAFERARDALGAAGHGDLGFVEHNLGLVAAALGDHAAALAHYARAAAIYARTIGADAPAPIRLELDRAQAHLATRAPAEARAAATRARTAATRAGIAWIVDEADAILAAPRGEVVAIRPPRPPVAVEPAPPTAAVVEPVPAAVTPVPEPPPPPPPTPPKRDVGVYGSSQGW